MGRRPTQKERRDRAFRAYLDLLDTAEWMKSQMRGQLELFDMTYAGLRVLEMLYREGRMAMADVARARQHARPNLEVIVRRLEEHGWVRREFRRLPPVKRRESRIPKRLRGKPRVGRRVAMVGLTPAGAEFVGNVLPRHAKVVKAFMRALGGREQKTLSRICGKLREGDVLKFATEMMYEYPGERSQS